MQIIPATFQSIALDSEIIALTPTEAATVELVAAAAPTARKLAGGSRDPDRHDFLVAIPAYLKALPTDQAAAIATLRRDASAELNIPGMAQDVDHLSTVSERLADAQAEAEAAQAMQGERLRQIQTLERKRSSLSNLLTAWHLDFASIIAKNEALILAHYGQPGVVVIAPFETIHQAEIIQRLAPGKIAEIKGQMAEIDKELATFSTPAPQL